MAIGAGRVVDTLTNPLGPVGAMAGVPNPFEIAAQPENARQAAYALITEAAITSAASAGVGTAVAGPASAGSSLSVVPETSAARFNSFVGKSSAEIEQMFLNKRFQQRGPDPVNGFGGYVNPCIGRSFHIDLGGQYKKGFEAPHVVVSHRTNFGISSIRNPSFSFERLLCGKYDFNL
jgi:hypothetical protein